ncbi:DMT family transporter [Ottowia sp.]|uniref:DMT family transporter n=1 Tax=Ottowia sp. TaxID=1898956 RepID=UPI002CDF1CF1|nr:DMT family transporter [Ottowia sp.]HRN75827.1 DMT family transporter [Ottowia sp.]HRQ03515.1 DMT family transporter [Ottowia sp.]
MRLPLQSPATLLLAVGALLGLNFPLGKLARLAEVSPTLWAALISLSVSLVLGGWLLLQRRPQPWNAQYARYFVLTGVFCNALPNLLILSALLHLGSGPTSVMLTLSPMVTALLSRLAGLRAPGRLEYGGIAVGFVGALLVVLARGNGGASATWLWMAVGLSIPLLLGVGNVYRSLDWPQGADETWLSVGSHAVAAVLLLAACALTGAFDSLPRLLEIPWIVIAQMVASVLTFPLFFRLQAVGGPVLLSQIGTVAAAVGVAVGAGLLGERYPPGVWSGVLLIALGIGLTVRAQRGRSGVRMQ